MATSSGAAATGTVIAVIGAVIALFGVGMFASGTIFSTETSRDNGLFGIGGSSSSSTSLNVMPLLGIVMAVVGVIVLVIGLRGTMDSFERGQERAEGTRHHLTIKKE